MTIQNNCYTRHQITIHYNYHTLQNITPHCNAITIHHAASLRHTLQLLYYIEHYSILLNIITRYYTITIQNQSLHYVTKQLLYNTIRFRTIHLHYKTKYYNTIANKNKLESSFYTTLQLTSLLFISDIFPAETSFAGIVPLTKSVKLTIIKPFNYCIHQIICKCSNFNLHSTSCRNRFRAR